MSFKTTLNNSYKAIAIRDYETAEKYALELLDYDDKKSGTYLLLGNIYTKKGDNKKAIQSFNKSIELNKDNPEAYTNLAIKYRKSGNISASLSAIKKAYALTPKHHDICYNIANLYKQTGDFDNAVIFYKKALELKPDFSLVYNNIGTLYDENNDQDSAIEWYKKGLEADSNNPTLHYNIGVIYETRNELEKALAEYKRALKSRPGWSDSLNNMGITLQKLGRHDEAVNTFKNMLKVQPDNVQAHNNISVALTDLDRLDEAKEHLNKALALDPGYFSASLNLSRVKEESGEKKAAIEDLRKLLHRDSKNTEILLRLSKLLMNEGSFTEASKHIRNLLKIKPDSSCGYLLLGSLNIRSGKKKRALTCFNRSINLNPINYESLYQRALLLRDLEEFVRSISDVSRILADKPKSYEGRFLLAELYLKQNLYKKALEIFLELHEETSENKDILTALVETYKKMDDKDSAIKTIENLISLQGKDSDSDTMNQMGSTLKIYDQLRDEYAEKYEELWNRNLEAFFSIDSETMEEEGGIEEESIIVETIPEFDNEIVPILDIGGIEPVIEVNEDEEILNLSEMEEELNLPDEVEMELERELKQIRETAQKERESENNIGPNSNGSPNIQYIPVPVPQNFPQSQPVPVYIQPPPIQQQPVYMQTPSYPPPPPVQAPQENPIPPVQEAPAPVQSEIFSDSPIEEIEEDHPEEKESNPANLLGYLENLTQFLPDEKREKFESSDMHLKLETLRAKISGKESFSSKIDKKHTLPQKKMEIKITTDKVENTFSYIDKLSTFLPDKSISSAMKGRIQYILENMRKKNE